MDTIQSHRSLFIFEGIAFIVLGALAVALPSIMTLGIELFIGWLFLFGGLVQGFRAIKSRQAPGFVPALISAALSIIIGILLLAYPLQGVLTLTVLLTIFFFLEGIIKMALSWQVRPVQGWGWLFLSGIFALALAILIWSGWPGTAIWAIGLIVGINMLFFGSSILTLALSNRD
jgi:uncharacterized membrane protein HdeD (DUF308 family)